MLLLNECIQTVMAPLTKRGDKYCAPFFDTNRPPSGDASPSKPRGRASPGGSSFPWRKTSSVARSPRGPTTRRSGRKSRLRTPETASLTLPRRTPGDSWTICPPSHGSTETLALQRCSPRRITQAELVGSAMRPATWANPGYFLSLLGGSGTEKPSLLPARAERIHTSKRAGPLLRGEASACRVLFSRSTRYCKWQSSRAGSRLTSRERPAC